MGVSFVNEGRWHLVESPLELSRTVPDQNGALVSGVLTFRVLGPPEIAGIGAGFGDEIFAQPKRLALLAYLAIALPRGFRRRDELLALLWPESDALHARNSLRQSVHVLRRHLPAGTLVARGREEVGLSKDRFQTDAGMFEEHLDHAREAEALALYRGDLLPGFHLGGCADFEAWLDGERQRLRRRAVRGALVLAKRCALDDETARAEEWARFAASRAPHDTDVVSEVGELLEMLGAARLDAGADNRFRNDLGTQLTPRSPQMGRNVPVPGAQNGVSAPTPATPSALVRARHVTDEARRHYLEAKRQAAQRSPATIIAAIEGFTCALRLSPDYAEAEAGLASALCQATVYVAYPGIDTWPRIRAHALRAVRLDPTLGDAHAALALVAICHDYDWTSGERIFRRALELDPISATSRQLYALYFLTAVGRTDEALGILDRARDSIPEGPGISVFCGMCCVFGQQFERACREVDIVLATQPLYVQAHWVRGMALEGLGDLPAAIEAFETGLALSHGSSLLLGQLGRACARAGEHERACAILSELDRRGETGGPGPYYVAEILAALGRADAALDKLYAAYRQRNPLMVFAGVSPGLDPLRGQKRFRELLMRLGIRTQGK